MIQIHESQGKVDQIIVTDEKPSDRADIIKRFNNLLSQFQRNQKYVQFDKTAPIPLDTDIYNEIRINHKVYDGVFYLKSILKTNVSDGSNSPLDVKYTEDYNLTKDSAIGSATMSITEQYGKFYIRINYDNLLNTPKGEDL